MELNEIKSKESVKDAELQARATNLGGRYTKLYIARDNGREIALVALDFLPSRPYLWFYEILVPRLLRQKGAATSVIGKVERLAVQLGYCEVRLHPKSLDPSFAQQALVSWYERQGYKRLDEPGLLTYAKVLACPDSSVET